MNTSCELPVNLSTEARCALVEQYDNICEGGGYVAYTALVICQESSTQAWVLTGIILWLLFLFLSVSVAADEFFTPNIGAIVAHLKISENIAGVTFMAFGNGAPDIFASMASVLGDDEPKVGLAVGGLIGAGVFVTTVVVGSMVLVRPFEVMRRPLMRDMLFYLIAVAWTFVTFMDDTLRLWETLGFIGIYVVFVLVVIISRIVGQRVEINPRCLPSKATRVVEIAAEAPGISTIIVHDPAITSNTSAPIIQEPVDVDAVVLPLRAKCKIAFTAFLTAMSPVRKEEWDGNLAKKIFAIVKAPIILIGRVTIPQAGNSWSKMLAIFQSFTCPLFAVIAAQQVTWSESDGWPQLWAHMLVLGILPAILILVFTNYDHEPRFFKPISAFFGFLMSVFWIYSLANEVVGILQMVGVVTGLSHEVLGLTLLAWSNSLGDLVSDISVARQGYPKMGISAAFGSPLTNLLIGFGLPFTIAVLRSPKQLSITFSSVSKVLLATLAVSLVSSLVLLPAQRFFARRPYGVYLIVLYLSFLVIVVLTQIGVLFGGVAPDVSSDLSDTISISLDCGATALC